MHFIKIRNSPHSITLLSLTFVTGALSTSSYPWSASLCFSVKMTLTSQGCCEEHMRKLHVKALVTQPGK